MSLTRNKSDSSPEQKESLLARLEQNQEQIYQKEQPMEELPSIPSLEQIWKQIVLMREENLQKAENEYQLVMYQTLTEQMCRTLMTFTEDMRKDIQNLTETQLKLVGLEREYTSKVGNEIDRLALAAYEDIKAANTSIIDKKLKEIDNHYSAIIRHLKQAVNECDKAVKNVKSAISDMIKIDTISKLLYFSSPVFVLVDIFVRIFF